MDALTRIAIALESIARDLHTPAVPKGKKEEAVQETIQQMSLFNVHESKDNERIRQIQSENAKHPRWSIREVHTLKRMLDNNFGYKDIASTINRSHDAVRSKANKMGWGINSMR